VNAFTAYGQKGLPFAVAEGAFRAVQDLVDRHKGEAPQASGTGPDDDPTLQAAYLERISIPAVALSDPFRPLAEDRQVTVQVRFPNKYPGNGAFPEELRQALADLPVPDHLKVVHHGAKLFSKVERTGQTPGTVTYHFVNNTALDDKGEPKPVNDEKAVPANIETFNCTLPRDEASAAPEGSHK
jgi:hypothetical protein